MSLGPRPIVFLPDPPDTYSKPWMSRLLDSIRGQIDGRVSRDGANHSLLLQSDGGKVFEVRVSDAGALIVTHIQG